MLLYLLTVAVAQQDTMSNKLETGKTEPLEVGSPYSVWCRVGEGVSVEQCVWRHEQGGEMTVDGDNLLDDNNNIIGGISVNTSDHR